MKFMADVQCYMSIKTCINANILEKIIIKIALMIINFETKLQKRLERIIKLLFLEIITVRILEATSMVCPVWNVFERRDGFM